MLRRGHTVGRVLNTSVRKAIIISLSFFLFSFFLFIQLIPQGLLRFQVPTNKVWSWYFYTKKRLGYFHISKPSVFGSTSLRNRNRIKVCFFLFPFHLTFIYILFKYILGKCTNVGKKTICLEMWEWLQALLHITLSTPNFVCGHNEHWQQQQL